ncbi:DUF2971 domain-containing protein [Candidatus Sulfurimonas marisnigri]|uniref:DUF2971 domain-containing protein n=1 Tax=Candidatus Sulfurimonas marisnigri TaxID=2740405 RepID=A0A7S7M277_9BACT|nr:DUF2971 domain-containing protein [Candidatus Sulfurimonas marisnigri]QOY55704.1 DUF2971 domain-containing protein [Candidatus Sulfurimonas marisnigri]
MKDNIPEINSYFGFNKCKEHKNIYISDQLPCPHPNCKHGLQSETFIDNGIPYSNKIIYIRKSWKGFNGENKYIWIREDELIIYISNIIYDEVFQIIKGKSSDSIYHYTTLDTLNKILESNELWLTEWKCTNDKVEIKHGLKITDEFNRDRLKIEDNLKTNNYFISSFSYEINNVTLFDRYADKAQGVAIEFDTKFDCIPRENFWYRNAEFMKLMPVIYEEDIQRKIIQYAFSIYENTKEWLAESKEHYNFDGKVVSKKERKKMLEKFFITTIEEIISFFKHPSFKDEREIRWLYRFDSDFIKEHKFNLKMKKLNDKSYYTSTDAHDMSYQNYYNLDEKSKINLPIKSIILGSKVENQKKVISELNERCKMFGFQNIEIRVSEIPYR